MIQQRITFEWVVEENQVSAWQESEPLASRAFGLARGEQLIANSLLRGLSLLLVALLAAAGAGLTPQERERREAQEGIDFSINLENQAWTMRDRRLYESLIDPNVHEDWVFDWREAWRTGVDEDPPYHAQVIYVQASEGLMQASILTEQPAFEWWQTNPYREERFYRRAGQRWLRTVPPADYWGEPRQLETAHLRFLFYARDAEAVQIAADQLEAAYRDLYQLLGVTNPPANATKLTVAISPQPVDRWAGASDVYELTSPILARIPAGQSDGDYLAYEVMNWFTYRALRDVTPSWSGRYLYRWPILIWGLRGWLRDDLLPNDSPWRMEARQVLAEAAPDYLPLGLTNITELRGDARPSREEVIMRYLAAESLIAYIMETYGQDSLPPLLDAMVKSGDWEEMIPELYGITPQEFVADWNMHLLENYGLE